MDKTKLTLIDHVALTVADVEVSSAYYLGLFGGKVIRDYRNEERSLVRAILIGGGVQLSIHQLGNGVDLVARQPTPGSADICFRFAGRIEEARDLLLNNGVEIVEGPAPRDDCEGRPAQSVYFHDPDGNLIELMVTD